MSREDKAERLTILTRMCLGHPGDIDEERMRWMLTVTEAIPTELLMRACALASQRQWETPFAPGPGQIVRAALDLDTSPIEYLPNTGTQRPKWYREGIRRLKGDLREAKPLQAGHAAREVLREQAAESREGGTGAGTGSEPDRRGVSGAKPDPERGGSGST